MRRDSWSVAQEAITVQVNRQEVRALRVWRAMSQEDLARRAGVAPNTIIKCERGGGRPHPSTFCKVAQALGVSPEDLMVKGRGTGARLTPSQRETDTGAVAKPDNSIPPRSSFQPKGRP